MRFKKPIDLLILTALISSCTQKTPSKKIDEEVLKQITLKSHHQLTNFKGRFDLSGMIQVNGINYAVADKKEDKYIYKINILGKEARIDSRIPVPFSSRQDIEGISYCDEKFYLVEEWENRFYEVDLKGTFRQIKFLNLNEFGIDLKNWKPNAGFEGVAVDCKNKLAYLLKEREPRFILTVELKTEKIIEKFDPKTPSARDFSDAYFENGFLYLLERQAHQISKVDPKSKKVVEVYSFKETFDAKDQQIYGPSIYGLAESLFFTKDEIWIGIDNNRLKPTPYGKFKFKLDGSLPSIFIFNRPKGF